MLVLENNVDIELLIEGNRDMLFQKITNPPPHNSSVAIISPDQTSEIMQDPFDPPQIVVPAPSYSNSSINVNYSLEFRVIDYYFSRQEKPEYVFRVKYRSDDYYYYAFEFKDYIVCPAFLLASFEQINYACIRVSHKRTSYYYILVKKGPENPFSDILAGHKGFQSEYIFKPPTDKQRVLNLNSKNKDIKYFYKFELDSEDPIINEWNDMHIQKT